MKTFGAIVSLLAAVVGTLGCRPAPEIRTRYTLEKQLWTAQQLEKAISAKHPYDTPGDWEAANHAYRAILDAVPASDVTNTWTSIALADIERIVLLAKLGLIRLCFVDYRTGAAVSYFKAEIFDFQSVLLDTSSVKLRLGRPIYSSIGIDTLSCRPLLREVVDSGALVMNYVPLGDTLLSFPIFFAQVIRDNGTPEQYVNAIDAAETFYRQIIDAWPDRRAGRKATYYRARLRLLDGRLAESESDVRWVIEQNHDGIERGDLLLLEGRILGEQGRLPEAEAAYNEILAWSATAPQSHVARLNIAAIRIREGKNDEAATMLRNIEENPRAPQEVIARAALLRARVLEDQGRWKEAFELLRWTCRLHPYTLAAVHAPIVALRHDLAEGNRRDAENTLELATNYYLQVIAMDSAFLPYRHWVKDFLVECYLLMGQPEVVAEILEREGQKWRGDNGAVALLKSGLIYKNLLGDTEKSAAVLKKSVELFPRARYGMITQAELDRITTPQNGDP